MPPPTRRNDACGQRRPQFASSRARKPASLTRRGPHRATKAHRAASTREPTQQRPRATTRRRRVRIALRPVHPPTAPVSCALIYRQRAHEHRRLLCPLQRWPRILTSEKTEAASSASRVNARSCAMFEAGGPHERPCKRGEARALRKTSDADAQLLPEVSAFGAERSSSPTAPHIEAEFCTRGAPSGFRAVEGQVRHHQRTTPSAIDGRRMRCNARHTVRMRTVNA